MKIKSDEITSVIKQEIEQYSSELEISEVGQVVEARCTGVNRGGLEMEVDHHKGFMPAGQVDLRHLEDISVFIGEKFPCKVIELKKNKNRLVVSRKAVMLEEREASREKLMETHLLQMRSDAKILQLCPIGGWPEVKETAPAGMQCSCCACKPCEA